MVGSEWKPEVHLKAIVQAEAGVINRRREAVNAANPELQRPVLDASQTGSDAPILDVTALALSGGGIRSASFSLGVLQALNEHSALNRIDYLSTVSGGGYMGSALSATMTQTEGRFVFGQSTGARGGGARPADVQDTDPVGHLRNYSNYLIPFGIRDLLTAFAIVFRGLIANLSLVVPWLLFLAALTILSNPYRSDLVSPNFFGLPLEFLQVTNFGITLLISLLAFPIFFIWAASRSRLSAESQSEFRTTAPVFFAGYLVVIAASFFMELQPFLVDGMFGLAEDARAAGGDGNSLLTAFVTRITAIAAPVAAIVTLFRQQVGTLLKSVTKASGLTTKLMAIGARAAIWIAGAAIPLLLWVGYLYLCYWGIINDTKPEPGAPSGKAAIQSTVEIKGPGVNLRGNLDCLPNALRNLCAAPGLPDPPSGNTGATQSGQPRKAPDVEHTPEWLINAAGVTYNVLRSFLPLDRLPSRIAERVVMWFYFVLAIVLFCLSYLLTPNANSLHRLYRDRLSKAFLFDPRERSAATTAGVDLGRDFVPIDTMRISALAPKDKPIYAPYHLINAALNIQGSDFANRRGRNADFFLFSPLFVGSEATGYAETTALEEEAGLDLPTAMAISGAAFSSNMGANSIRALTPTLALLNVRTGYWLKNPLAIAPRPIGVEGKEVKKRFGSKFYLWSEITGRLYEDSEDVYITDGGHIENLGIYELLRRRCKVIVVVDAEADPSMRMPSLIALQRYARIDLGVRINLPWDDIRKSTMCWMGYGAEGATNTEKPPTRSSGPHAAIGTIDYDGGKTGWLLYIKSSLTGDENDYVRDYARRYDQFPHESTGDQFFSEEQFEVYRALGFHIAHRLLSDIDEICVFDSAGPKTFKFNAQDNDSVKAVRQALLGT